jgi:poly(3-hydroxybutyrate) depolymerase
VLGAAQGKADATPDAPDALADPPCLPRVQSAGDTTHAVTIEGVERIYRLHIPAAIAARPTPVVLAFHGGGGNAEAVELGGHFIAKSDLEGFVLVRGEGTLDPPPINPRADVRVWNAGVCCGKAVADDVDDVGYVRAVLDDLASRVCIDDARVFATGLSNGALLAHRLGCELSRRRRGHARHRGRRRPHLARWLDGFRSLLSVLAPAVAGPVCLLPAAGGADQHAAPRGRSAVGVLRREPAPGPVIRRRVPAGPIRRRRVARFLA